MVAVIIVDAYPFFWLSQTCPVTVGVMVFSGCTVLPDS